MTDAPAPPPPQSQGLNEDLYQATAAVLVEPERTSSPWAGLGCLLVTVVLFALSILYRERFATLAFILPVLLLHEAGHFVGMRLFGYRNLRMFFIPFFGAAVSGRKHAAPSWQQVIVLLLGPLPGIALALVLQATLRPSQDTWHGDLVIWLVILNGLNLLPIVPLDGGRIVDVLFFAQRPWSAVALRVLASLALLAIAILLWQQGLSYFEAGVLALMAAVVLLGAPLQYRRTRLQLAFGHNPLGLPERLDEMGDAQRRELFGWATRLYPLDRDPVTLAGDLRDLHEHMVSRRPAPAAWAGLFALYLAGFALSIAALALSFDDTRTARLERIDALLAHFAMAHQEIEAIRAESNKVPRSRHPELRERQRAAWQALVEDWQRTPERPRRMALQALDAQARAAVRGGEPGAERRLMDLSRLAGDLGLSSALGPRR